MENGQTWGKIETTGNSEYTAVSCNFLNLFVSLKLYQIKRYKSKKFFLVLNFFCYISVMVAFKAKHYMTCVYHCVEGDKHFLNCSAA